MNRVWSLFRPPHEAGAPGRSRVFVYLALAVIALLLSYQLVLNHGSLESVSPWRLGDAKEPAAEPPAHFPVLGSLNITRNGTTAGDGAVPEKELVIAAMRKSDMSWLDRNVSQWTTNVYRADADKAETNFTVPQNKGNEAMVYLTYVLFTVPKEISTNQFVEQISYRPLRHSARGHGHDARRSLPMAQ